MQSLLLLEVTDPSSYGMSRQAKPFDGSLRTSAK